MHFFPSSRATFPARLVALRRRAADARYRTRADVAPEAASARRAVARPCARIINEVFKTIRAIESRGTTILFVEQNATIALRTADRCYVIERGRVVREGLAANLLADPAIISAYLGT